MSALTIQDIISDVIQVVVLIYIIIISARLIDKGNRKLLPVFFTFAMVSFLLSDLYYLIYDVLWPDTRMPFAANEIAECATILLLSAGLETLPDKKEKPVIRELIFTVLFMSANIALWIVWSGEWVQDIVFGLPYVYFLYIIVRGLNRFKVLGSRELAVGRILCVVIIAAQIVLLKLDGIIFAILDTSIYVLIFGMAVWFLVKCIKVIRENDVRRKGLYISHGFYLWTTLVMFMSAGTYYTIATGLNTVSLVVILTALKKELSFDDIH